MKISLFTLTSPIHDKESIERNSREFLDEIAAGAGCEFETYGEDYEAYNDAQQPVIFVRTGGTEGLFKRRLDRIGGYVRLLTSGKSNSLAASMEILSYLRQNGREGEILHGSTDYIAARLREGFAVERARRRLQGLRLGVVGAPSDWLIASGVDRGALLAKLGVTLVDIPIGELVAEVESVSTDSPEWRELMAEGEVRDFDAHAPEALKTYREGAFRIYLALDRIIQKYGLGGFTLRCFDLLTALNNTGCMALAMFNARGIPACCEGDIPALLTMTVGNALTGCCGFQANPSRIDVEKDEMTFAHCTVPFNMVRNCSYHTHFESGIGIAIRGELEQGEVTIAKIAGNLSRAYVHKARLIANLSESSLCRTQVVVRGERFADYFLSDPIGNHHIIFPGDHSRLFEAFMRSL